MPSVESSCGAVHSLGSLPRAYGSWRSGWPAKPRLFGFLWLAVLAAATTIRLDAQQGLPIVQKSSTSGDNTASPVYIDAKQWLLSDGNDACLAIRDAIGQMGAQKNGVVDARAITGDVLCSVNMFGPSNPTGKLLLGDVVIHAQATQVQPTKFQVEGVGWRTDGTSVNTVIRACWATYDTNCGGNTLQNYGTTSTPIVWCWGVGGTCSGYSGINPPPDVSFGSLTQYMSFDCTGLSKCVAMEAYNIQEGSGCWHCQFHGWGNDGIGLQICHKDSRCQNSLFQDLFVTIDQRTAQSETCTYASLPIIVDTGGKAPGPKLIKGVTIDSSHNCNYNGTNSVAPYPYESIRFSSQETSLEDVLVGQGSTIGLHVAADSDVNSVTIMNVQSGNTYNYTSGTQYCSKQGTQTTTVLLDDHNNHIYNTTLLSVGNVPGGSGSLGVATNVIVDCNNGIIKNSGTQGSVAIYALGKTQNVAENTNSKGNLSVVSSASPAMDLSTADLQQLACPSSGATVSPTVSNQLPGMELTFIFVQIGAGFIPCSVSFPSTMHGATVSTANSSVTTQKFIVSNNGTDLYAEGAASIYLPGVPLGTTCGTP